MNEVSTRVIEVIAEEEGTHPAKLSPRLYDVIDPEALDTLTGVDSVEVRFEYAGYSVTVTDKGVVDAKPA